MNINFIIWVLVGDLLHIVLFERCIAVCSCALNGRPLKHTGEHSSMLFSHAQAAETGWGTLFDTADQAVHMLDSWGPSQAAAYDAFLAAVEPMPYYAGNVKY